MNKIKPIITLGLLSLALTVGISVQLKTIKSADLSGTIQLTDSNLKKSVLQWKGKYQDSTKKLEESEKKLDILRSKLTNSQQDNEASEKIKKYQILLGTTDVHGEGVELSVSDNNTTDMDDFSSLYGAYYLVHDGNLVAIVNELKAAGAEAISINDQRITDTTAITCAGNVIQINGEKVGSPFIIKAIGAKDLLYGEITKSDGTIAKLKVYGINVNISKKDDVYINKINY